MRKVIHLLPYDGLGGAELAAHSMACKPIGDLDFRLHFIFPGVQTQSQRRATFNPLAFASAARGIIREDPDVLIVSLWRSCVVGLLVKLFRPRVRLSVFIHNSVDAHRVDSAATRLAMRFADAIWADSEASIRKRFRHRPRAPVTVISFLTRRQEPLVVDDSPGSIRPAFIFWGRLAAQKNLGRALLLFAQVHRARADATFDVIGPDAGELSKLLSLTRDLGLTDAVRFLGPLDFPGIRSRAKDHAFYLQTSDYEGMAMSVVEAMQLGLVPVVTPVGEIGTYCRDGHNAVIVQDPAAAAARVISLLGNPGAWRELRSGAIATWKSCALYRDDVASACRRLTGMDVR